MAIRPRCDFCAKELTDYGGLLFSPPNTSGTVKKYHLCKKCYAEVLALKKKKPR